MNCPNCNKYYNDDFDFCPHCGTKKPEPLTCPNCGFRSNEYSFCPKCGEKLLTTNQIVKKQKREKEEEEERKRKEELQRLEEEQRKEKYREDLLKKLTKEIENNENILFMGSTENGEEIRCYFIDNYRDFDSCKIISYVLNGKNLIFNDKFYLDDIFDEDFFEDELLDDVYVDYSSIRSEVFSDFDERRHRNDDSYLEELEDEIENRANELKRENFSVNINLEINVYSQTFNVIANGRSFSIMDYLY